MERVGISEPIKEICDRLGLQADTVRWIEFFPDRVHAECYRLEAGRKFIDDQGEVSVEERTFAVRT